MAIPAHGVGELSRLVCPCKFAPGLRSQWGSRPVCPIQPRSRRTRERRDTQDILQDQRCLARPDAYGAVGDDAAPGDTPRSWKSCRNSAAFLKAPSAVRNRSAGRCTAPGMWPGRPAPAVAPDGQKRSPANSASERTSRMSGFPLPRVPCSASSDINCVGSASGSGYGEERAGVSVVQGRPASRQPSRVSCSIRARS